MSLYSAAMADAADITNIKAGGKSILDGAGDALVYGGTAAVISGLGSIYNTAAAGINMLGGSVDEIDTHKTLQRIDTEWADYYTANKMAIDTVGFVGASFIPGGLAIKGLNLARAGGVGGAFGRALGIPRTKQAEAMEAALLELGAEGGTVFSRINKNKAAAMAWGFADQTLTAAAFETGVALTMKQSPLLADDSWWDIGKTALTGAAIGGAIGGGIDSLILNKSFKKAVAALDSKQRGYDYVADLGGLNIATGDKAFAIADSLAALPKSVADSDKILELSFHLAGGTSVKKVDISKVLGNALESTERKAFLDFEIALQELSGDSTVSQPLAKLALERLKKLRSAGSDDVLVKEDLGDLLFNLKAARAATDVPVAGGEDLWYFNKSIKPEDLAKLKTVDDYTAAVRSSAPFKDNAYSKPYIFLGSAEQQAESFKNIALIGRDGSSGFPNLTAAWKAGRDVAIMPDGALRINDSSSLWKRLDDPVYKPSRFINTRTGAITGDAVLTAADALSAGKTLSSSALRRDAVYLETKAGTEILDMKVFKPDGDTRYFTARHAWASNLADADIPRVVNVNDFSLMDRLRTVDSAALDGVIITNSAGEQLFAAASGSLPDAIRNSKLAAAEKLFEAAGAAGKEIDFRTVAYQLNVDNAWLEQAVAKGFRAGQDELLAGADLPLSAYTRRETIIAEFATPKQFQELGFIKQDMSWQEKAEIIREQVATTGGQFVTGELAWAMRVKQATQVTRNASAAVLGTDKVALLPDLQQNAAKLANSLGSGATTFKSSNADYGDVLGLATQTAGKLTQKWATEARAEVVDALGGSIQRILSDKAAAAELGIITNIGRSTAEKYVFSGVNPKQLILRELKKVEGDASALQAATQEAVEAGKRATIDIESDLVADFLRQHSSLNSDRVSKRTVLNNARGFTSNKDPDTVYFPPIDTTYFKHFAFVRPIEGRAFGTSEVSMIFARDADELSKRIASVDRANFEVIPKSPTEKYFKAKEMYDFDLTMNEPRINSELQKTGALNNFQPEVRPENLAEDYLRWHQNQATRLVRDSVETHYAQQFAELRKLGETYSDLATSQFAGTVSKSKTEITNPYDDYIKTALDISKRSEYTFLHQANEFVDALGTRAYQGVQKIFGDAQKGMVTWQEANAQMERLGIRGVYNSKEEFFTANAPRDRNLIREYVSKANAFLANSVLRLDFFNSLVNVVSTPMMLGTELASIRSLIKSDPELVGKLAELTTVKIPGGGPAVPSMTKLVGQAVANMTGPRRDELLARYVANRDITDALQQHASMLDNLALRADFKLFSDGVNKAFETGAKITGNNLSEQSTRFVTADVMRQLTEPLVEAGKLSLKEQNAYISVFTNRVQGNYISSQRPIVFQGVLGSAVSLFQTYSFNLMQQLLRHVENKDKRAVATLFGMQAGTFGLNGTPFFEAINTHIIGNAAVNQGHYDAYSLAPQLLSKDYGDWLMYGTASAFPAFGDSWPALYTRGDINPRHASILPLTPADIPAIDASTRVVKNLMGVGSKLVAGADISETLLQGLEHNGLNRPLAGMAQLLNGKSTTSKGALISASSDFDLISTASRIGGAKPMDEAIALNSLYRNKSYQIADQERMGFLGEKVKSYLYKNQFPPDDVMETFMLDYAKAGGRLENFNAAMQRWAKQANRSTVEQMRTKMSSSYGQRLNEIMGGAGLEDYRTQAPVDLAAPDQLQ